MPVVIGLLGGVASGKSSVAARMAARGLKVLGADAIAREVVGQPELLRALSDRFGEDILDDEGRLDRDELARRAFADQAHTEALNRIVHPAVEARLRDELDRAGETAVVLDVPLLLESALADRPTLWVLVEASEEARDAHAAGRSWPTGERARREARQADLAAKRARAGHVLDNNGSIEDLERQVDVLLAKIGVVPAP